jgi:hypothetical protein
VHFNRSTFTSTDGGRFLVEEGTKVLSAGLKREFMVVHETLHQANHLNRLTPGVSFPSDNPKEIRTISERTTVSFCADAFQGSDTFLICD